jgi:hypothetical protein
MADVASATGKINNENNKHQHDQPTHYNEVIVVRRGTLLTARSIAFILIETPTLSTLLYLPSNSKTFGFFSRALAIAIRCFCPTTHYRIEVET